jgi:glycosyltransferase involved in cell wall biosynthesis
MRPQVAILTGGGDRPYALGLASSLIARHVTFDFIGSDDLESPELRRDPHVQFLNLRGDMSPDVPLARKVIRLLRYYRRLTLYTLMSDAPIFHILWNNKVEFFDRTLMMLFYKLFGKRIVFTVHNVNIRKRDGGDGLLNRLSLRMQYGLADHLFAHTERMKQELQSDFAVPSKKISVIPLGINNTVPDTGLTCSVARTQLGLAETHKTVLFFGSIAPYKGIEHLVEATALVARTIPDVRLIIAGRPKGPRAYWAGIERRIATLDLGKHVLQRIKYIPDADTELYFKAADVLALPYIHGYQSGVLFLGYNFGLPVIASDVASFKDNILEGETGFVCRPNDPVALGKAIERYFKSDLYNNLETHRHKIHRLANAQYSWTKVSSITVSVYEALRGCR